VDGSDADRKQILANLASMAVPMDDREFSREGYNAMFPRGTVVTPIGEVKLGQNQFEKLAEKDSGKRRPLIGAMYQTLSDPVVIITEKQGDRGAYVFIKSFRGAGEKVDTVMSIVVDLGGQKIAISTYKRKRREVVNKIKLAAGIVYIRDNSGGPTNRE
jgi:hypothetical protein